MIYRDKDDLTRWNRAGLSEFRYTDGNALTFLETLRQALVLAYDEGGTPSWEALQNRFPVPSGESRRQEQERLRKQYRDERRDYAWEILRSFARSSHVLGEYINAYANECYLSTAREWDNVRRLVGLLGYRPSPPASAQTQIALLYKEGESGTLKQGFAVKNKPVAGESTVVFETREDLEGDARLNLLRLAGWDRNPAAFIGGGGYDLLFPLQAASEDISVGDVGVLATELQAVTVRVGALLSDGDGMTLGLQVTGASEPDGSFRYRNTRLSLAPGFIASPLPHGQLAATVDKDVALASDEVVITEKSGVWTARRVKDFEKRHLRFHTGDTSPKAGEQLYRALILRRQRHPQINHGNPVYVLPEGLSADQKHFFGSDLKPTSVLIRTDVDHLSYIREDYGEILYYPHTESAAALATAGQTVYRFPGKNKGLSSGQWAWVRHEAGGIAAYPVTRIDQEEDWFEVALTGDSGTVALLQGDFGLTLAARDAGVNGMPAWEPDSTAGYSRLRLAAGSAMEPLSIGRKLICASSETAVTVTVDDLESGPDGVYIHVSPPLADQELAVSFTRHDTLVYGNVVDAGHGETQPEKIVGNGDASSASQSFNLAAKDISWVGDAEFSAGVRADLTLRVAQRTWKQVEDLSLSEPEDPHYQVEVNEDGELRVLFGDGRHGRRLPSGVDNVRVRYRTGYGVDGNLAAGGLVKIVRPDPLIDDFAAPLPASGGADKEPAASMRDSAPATVLALGRAVSLEDFTRLAAHHSMVWQARAFERMPNRPARPEVEVVVVAAGGAVFPDGSETAVTLAQYLKAHAVPDTPVRVVSYQPLFMALELTVMVDEQAYNSKQVETAILEHVTEQLALTGRELGQPLFRSEVIALLEQVEGVENGHCEIDPVAFAGLAAEQMPRLHHGADSSIRRVSIREDQLLYLDAERFPLQLTIKPYER